MDKLRWGILATGGIAEAFVQDLKTAGLEVGAVGSRSEGSAEKFAQKYGIARAHGSYEALVADPEIDIIYVATPHPYHAPCVKLALGGGKHVLVEKPFTLNAGEAKEIAALAHEKGLVLLEAMWTRFLPHIRRIHEIIAAGTLGDLRAVHADHRQFLPTDPKHRLNAPELGGGALLDLGIYPVSFAYDILGTPVSVNAMARFTQTGVDAEIAVTMKHAGDAISTSVSSLDCGGDNKATIYGSKARLEISPVWYTPTSFSVIDYEGNVLETFDETWEGRGMQFQAIALEELVRSGNLVSPLMPLEQSVEIMAMLDTIRGQIGLVYPGEKQ